MDRLGIAVLSHAHGHVSMYCNVLKDFDDVDLIATWDDNEERGRDAAERFGLEFRPEVDDVLGDPHVDTVMIGAETNLHAEFVERAAAARKHILCQKPMASCGDILPPSILSLCSWATTGD